MDVAQREKDSVAETQTDRLGWSRYHPFLIPLRPCDLRALAGGLGLQELRPQPRSWECAQRAALGAESFSSRQALPSTSQGEGFPAGAQRALWAGSSAPPPLFVPLLGAEISSSTRRWIAQQCDRVFKQSVLNR